MDLLVDVNVAIDVCAGRAPHALSAAAALLRCKDQGGRLWLYAGSVQTLEYSLLAELKRDAERRSSPTPSNRALLRRARELLDAFAADKHWLAALAGEGPVFGSADPEDEQLMRALERFPSDSIRLLTRDRKLLEEYPDRTISPQEYCALPAEQRRTAFVDLAAQQDAIREGIERRMHTVLHHGKYIMGTEVAELERRLAEFCGAKHAIGCASGTDALLMPLLAEGIGPGDAVIVPSFTFVATAEVVAVLGATPIFVDVHERTYLMRTEEIEPAIAVARSKGLRPRAVIAVDLFGQPADYPTINAIAARNGLFVIGDAAQSFGATLHGKRVGTLAPVTATSFFPAKPLGCYGDGGAVFTDDDALAERMRSIRVHGQGRDKYDNVRIGINGRLDTLQAAILVEKLRVFPEEIELRDQVARRYGSALRGTVDIPELVDGATSVWAQYTIQVDERDQVARRLQEAGIPTAVYYPTPLHRQTAYTGLPTAPGGCPVAERLAQRVLSLPMHPYLADRVQAHIVAVTRGALVRPPAAVS